MQSQPTERSHHEPRTDRTTERRDRNSPYGGSDQLTRLRCAPGRNGRSEQYVWGQVGGHGAGSQTGLAAGRFGRVSCAQLYIHRVPGSRGRNSFWRSGRSRHSQSQRNVAWVLCHPRPRPSARNLYGWRRLCGGTDAFHFELSDHRTARDDKGFVQRDDPPHTTGSNHPRSGLLNEPRHNGVCP